MRHNCSVVILAAGNSERMGFPKFLLEYSPNTTFLENIVSQYHRFGCKQIFVVANAEGVSILEQQIHSFPDSFAAVRNNLPELGRFYSLKLGLAKCNPKNPVFIHNADNPYIDQAILIQLANGLKTFDYIYPVHHGKGGHPLLVSAETATQILNQNSNDFNIKEILKRISGSTIHIDNFKILFNINTPSDYISMKGKL